LLVLGAACLARAEPDHPPGAVAIQIDESGPALGLSEALRGALERSGWTVAQSAGPHCVLRGKVTASGKPSALSVQYALEARTESGVSLGKAEGAASKISAPNARDLVVNTLLAQLTAALLAHAMPDRMTVEGVETDEEVRALKTAFGALPGVRGLVDEHFSNGTFTFGISTRAPARTVAEMAAPILVGGKRLDFHYAGVDLAVAALK